MSTSLDAMLQRLGGDRELLHEIACVFVEDAPRQIERLRDAIDRADFAAIVAAAHSLKGAVSNFDSDAAFDAATGIEAAARAGEMAAVHSEWQRLQPNLAALIEILRDA